MTKRKQPSILPVRVARLHGKLVIAMAVGIIGGALVALTRLPVPTCALVGWEYRLLGAPDAIETENVRWLAGYRHPRHRLPQTVEALRLVFATPAPLMAGAEAAGDRSRCCRCCSTCCGRTS